MDLVSKRVLVTGGHGFLGRHVLAALHRAGCRQVKAPARAECDLLREPDVERLMRWRPEVVLHLAARVGGIEANRRHPGSYLYQNLLMGARLVEACRLAAVEKFVAVGTICSYPKHASTPFREEALWDGYPEETNAPYGLAKKMVLAQVEAYHREFGFPGVNLLLVNLYGPGDNFEPSSSHVIPALVRKCEEAPLAGLREITVWGDGAATREFLFVEDAARTVVLAAQRLHSPEPVNVGTGVEISIRGLAHRIAEHTGFSGELRFDASRPAGQPRRQLDVSRARGLLGFEASVGLDEGLSRTVAWYRAGPARAAA